MSGGRRIMLVAVEPSADAIGASLMNAIQSIAPETDLFGCGGERMVSAGFKTLFAIDALAVMGFTDVAAVYFKAHDFARLLVEQALAKRADTVVFIDGWAFSRICASRFRKHAPHIRLVKYAAPQVWASRPQRVDFVRDHFDQVLCLLPFEPDWFERAGVAAAFVGNPNFEAARAAATDGLAFRARHSLGESPILLLALGSRRNELKYCGPALIETAKAMKERIGGLRIVAPLAPSIADAAQAMLASLGDDVIILTTAEKYESFSAATAALAVSGTVTTEIALCGAPQAIAYRADALTAFWARRVVTTKYASIINVAADTLLIPEFIQEACTVGALVKAVEPLLTDGAARERQRAAVAQVVRQFLVEGETPSERAAHLVLS